MCKRMIYLILPVALFAASAQAQFITSVAMRNGGAAPQIAPDPLAEGSLTFVDRAHIYADVPPFILGAQYVMLANDDKGISAYELDLTFAMDATLYVFVDNRMGGAAGGKDVNPNIDGMPWLTDMGFVDTGEDIGIDESADGSINQYFSIFSLAVKAGTITIYGDTEGHTGNMLGVAALGPKLIAYDPDPPDGAIHLETWISLGWTPGDTAASHDVYFGDNFEDVNNGTGDAYRGNQALNLQYFVAGFTGYPYPDGLVPGTTYYWRIDEIEADGVTIHRGNVWSFIVPSKKAYNEVPENGSKFIDPESVNLTWTAGLGARLHFVYFGDDYDTVANATGGLLQGGTDYDPGPLEMDKTYYWRVDESDGTNTYTGDVWSFSTFPDMPITDPNLLCWWKFDEEAGSTAVDHSGHNHHGTLEGDTKWVDGMVGGALEFDGTDDRVVDYAAASYLNGLDAITVCMWIKSNLVGTDKGFINGEEPDGGDNLLEMRYDAAGGNGGGTNVLKMAVVAPSDEQQLESSSNLQTTEWQHVAMVWSSGQQLKFYVNGVLDVPTDNGAPRDVSTSGITMLIVGQGGKDAGGGWDGLIDDVRIYDKVLTAEEITEAMRGEPDLAWNPSPDNRSTPDIKQAMPLSWSPGDLAAQHDVYFGTDKDAVDNADTSDTTGIYRGRQSLTSYTLPEGVEWGGGPYYWRIDEFNTDGTISKGRIWTFTVSDFILIDDFESYDAGENQIWFAWHDGLGYGAAGVDPYYAGNGTGAAVGDETTASYTEETIVHGGLQSMPLSYDNNKQGFAKYSETELTLTAPRDWTEEGVAELSIWFRGNPASVGSFIEGPVGTYTMTATGTDIWNTADQFHYAYKTLTGAGSIVAKVLSVDLADPWSKAGVMIRETLEPGSKFAAVYITPTDTDGTATNGCTFQGRLDTDVAAVSDSAVRTAEQQAIVAPYWVKLDRDVAGNFRGSYSSDGVTWRQMSWNPQNIPMSSTVYVGLALTAHNAAATCQAQFSNVTITGTVGGQWSHQDIGIISNAPEPLYVAISNSTGSPAVVYNDTNAATIDTWTEWVIPLSAFADQGINLTNVDSIAIGLGTQGNMTSPGGSGKMYIDDIRLYRPSEDAE